MKSDRRTALFACISSVQRTLSLLKPFKLRLLSLEPCSFPKASAKVELFTLHTKYFNNFFQEKSQHVIFQAYTYIKKIVADKTSHDS